jgi:hypothetical protein
LQAAWTSAAPLAVALFGAVFVAGAASFVWFGVVPDLALGVAGLLTIAFAVSRPRATKGAISSRAWRPAAATTARGRSGRTKEGPWTPATDTGSP